MGGIVHKDRRGTLNAGRESPTNDLLTNYDKNTLEAVKNVKDGPTTNIELTISCSNLPKFDFLSQTDARVYCFVEKDGKYEEYGKTEVVPNDPNPKFKTKLKVPYNFGKNQIVKFEIYDVDEFKEDESDKKDFIGHIIIPLHEIVCANNQTVTKDIIEARNRKNKQSTITIRGTEYDESSSRIFFHIGARQFVSKNELSLHLSVVEGQEITFLGKCEHILNNKKGFDWPEFSLPSNAIPDERTIIRFEVFERTKQKPKILIGSAEATLGSMLNYSGKVFKILKEGFSLGELKIKECKRVTQYTFLNYVYGGAEISLIIAIDFTNSNKDPSDEKSLHFISENYDNEYLQALKSIGGILQYYDSDKKIPLFGFGAKLPPHYNSVSHCFSMNNNYFDPEVNGLQEVIDVYKQSLKSFKFHGPTIFSEVLGMAVEYANYEKNQQGSQKYLILLIMTDGDISDMQATKDQLVKAAELPLSILIVGVGSNEFQQMKVLDGDIEPIISSNGVECKRDIVQFVPFSKYKDNYEALARETLAEIPNQFLDYMSSQGIEPVLNKNNAVIGKGQDYLKSQTDLKKRDSKPESHIIPSFLQHTREEFTQKLLKLEIEPHLIEEILNEGISAPDVGLFIELASEKKKSKSPKAGSKQSIEENAGDEADSRQDIDMDRHASLSKLKTKQIVLNKERNIEAEKSKAKEESYKITQKLLEERDKELMQRKIQALGIEYVQKNEPKPEGMLKKRKVFAEFQDHNEHFKALTRDTTPISVDDNICLSCRENLINTVFMPCGHAALCQNCLASQALKSCVICKQKSQYFMTTTKAQ